MDIAKSKDEAPQKQDYIPVKTSIVKKSNFENYIRFIGTTIANKKATLLAPSGGEVNLIHFFRGEDVKKGEKLCNIDGKRSKLMLDRAKLQVKIASEKLERTKSHVKKGTSSRIHMENDELVWYQSKLDLISAKEIYEGAYCIAPFSGTIGNQFINQFDQLSPNQVTYEIIDLDKIKVDIDVPENNIHGYQKGNTAKLFTDRGTNKFVEGSIINIGKSITPKIEPLPWNFYLKTQSIHY